MTDKEIIKALECCGDEKFHCTTCPCYLQRSAKCVTTLMLNALNLINRQKAEIERLNAKLQKQDFYYNKAIEDYVKEYNIVLSEAYSQCEERVESLKRQLKESKSEAIKEFAERLKIESAKLITYRITATGGIAEVEHHISGEAIDNLVKEMTEANQ